MKKTISDEIKRMVNGGTASKDDQLRQVIEPCDTDWVNSCVKWVQPTTTPKAPK